MNIEWTSTLDSIFAAVLVGGMDPNDPNAAEKRSQKMAVHKQSIHYFKGLFKENIFEDEYAILYEILTKLNIDIFVEEQVALILNNNQDIILKSSVIDFDRMLSTIDDLRERVSDVDKFEVVKALVIHKFIELSNMSVDLDTFKSNCNLYVQLYTDYLAEQMINNMALILHGGAKLKMFDGRTHEYVGLEGVKQYYLAATHVIDSLKSSETQKSTVVDEQWLQEQLNIKPNTDDLKLFDFGVDEIDKAFKYFRRSQMLGILGPPKGGKTRTSAYLAARALSLGYNVTIWPLEGNRSEWEGMILANIIKIDTGIEMDAADITNNSYDPEYQQYIINAKTKLAIGIGRGKLSFIEETAYCETFIDVLRNHYETQNAFDVIIMDSLVNILSLKGKSKSERISESYEILKTFITHGLPVAAFAIIPAQLKQDVVDWLRKNPNETIDVTAGGESAATIRSPDYVIGVFSSKQERNEGMMKFYCVATRHRNTFDDFYARCALGCCYYESDPSLNEE